MKKYVLAGVAAAALVAGTMQSASARDAERAATSVSVKDKHDDVSKQGSNKKVSHAIDIYQVKASATGKNLVLAMTVDNLTKKNTTQQTMDGMTSMPVLWDLQLQIPGTTKRWFDVTWGNEGPSVKETSSDGTKMLDCGAKQSADLDADTLRFTVPKKCFTKVTKLVVFGATHTLMPDQTYGDVTSGSDKLAIG